jgi:hypothetical protein
VSFSDLQITKKNINYFTSYLTDYIFKKLKLKSVSGQKVLVPTNNNTTVLLIQIVSFNKNDA